MPVQTDRRPVVLGEVDQFPAADFRPAEVGADDRLPGAAGFLGSCVSRRWLVRGDEVVVLDILNVYYDTALKYGRLGFLGVVPVARSLHLSF